MNKTYSTLSSAERQLIQVPSNPTDVDVEMCGDGHVLCITVTYGPADESIVMIARRIGGVYSEVYDVSADVWLEGSDGEVRYTQTVAFTTTKGWLQQWTEMVEAHLPGA
jgi:hypothetical protein